MKEPLDPIVAGIDRQSNRWGMKLYFVLVAEFMIVALPVVLLASWLMSKLLMKEPPRGWWNK